MTQDNARGAGALGGKGVSTAPSLPLADLAQQILNYFDDAVSAAEAALASFKAATPDAFASVNTLTGSALQALNAISEDSRRNLEAVILRPAIARVEVLNDIGEREVIFITPAGAPSASWGQLRVASYRSPVGRLAAIPVGQDIEVRTEATRGAPGRARTYDLVARARLNPIRPAEGWDSRDTVVEALGVRPLTDFSPVQLACMGGLCDPAANSFVACGDFNQRITSWGARSEKDLRWVFPDIQIRRIRITYRHSRQLNALAHAIASLAGEDEIAVLPEHVDNEGVDPVIGIGLEGDKLIAWLKDRILEIERLTQVLPSIAVLVNREAEVQPLADALKVALSRANIPVSACPGGLVRGNDNEVRVFDVQHIKGLEFEAVFFVGVDDLARTRPDLFDKFLYVGVTRAAVYLGLTITSDTTPKRLNPILPMFGTNWA